MLFWINIILGLGSIVAQSLVVYYGLRLFKVVGHTEHWSLGWKFYLAANGVILLRRVINFATLVLVTCEYKLLKYIMTEEVLAIVISVLLLLFGRELSKLFSKYVFKSNGC